MEESKRDKNKRREAKSSIEGETTLTSTIQRGSRVLHVEDTSGFTVGNKVYIECDEYSEMHVVTTICPKASSLTLDSCIWHEYVNGATVRVVTKKNRSRKCKICRGDHQTGACFKNDFMGMCAQPMLGLPTVMPMSMPMGLPTVAPLTMQMCMSMGMPVMMNIPPLSKGPRGPELRPEAANGMAPVSPPVGKSNLPLSGPFDLKIDSGDMEWKLAHQNPVPPPTVNSDIGFRKTSWPRPSQAPVARLTSPPRASSLDSRMFENSYGSADSASFPRPSQAPNSGLPCPSKALATNSGLNSILASFQRPSQAPSSSLPRSLQTLATDRGLHSVSGSYRSPRIFYPTADVASCPRPSQAPSSSFFCPSETSATDRAFDNSSRSPSPSANIYLAPHLESALTSAEENVYQLEPFWDDDSHGISRSCSPSRSTWLDRDRACPASKEENAWIYN